MKLTGVGEEGFDFEPGGLGLRTIHFHFGHPVVLSPAEMKRQFNTIYYKSLK